MEPDEPAPKKYGIKPREFERLNAKGPAGRSAEHDIYAMLQQNLAIEKKAGLNEVEIKEVKSRRKRDYWLLLVPSIGTLALAAWLGRANPYVLVPACSGIVLVSIGLTWVMWFVMDDY